MWMKILILVVVVAVVIYGFRALGGKRSARVRDAGSADSRPPAREDAVNLIACSHCGAYTPEGKSCSSCGKSAGG